MTKSIKPVPSVNDGNFSGENSGSEANRSEANRSEANRSKANRSKANSSKANSSEMPQAEGFEKDYSEDGFWAKSKRFAKTAGREVIEKALLLFYAAQSDKTPFWAKTVIFGALGYFINALDAIPDLTPIVGYADDLGVLVAAIATVAAFISPQSKEKAEQKLEQWFGPAESSEKDEKEGKAP